MPRDLVAFYLPMHTATRLALPAIDRVRALNPSAHLCAYGLYAPLNGPLLRERGVQTVLGPEFEGDLAEVASRLMSEHHGARGVRRPGAGRQMFLPRVAFMTPDRSGLPPLTQYASLQVGAARKTVGYTEATRGCKHRCRHCPIVPVYDGRFRAVPADVVLADIRAQVAAGAEHITFGDPDFFNGPGHARAIVEALAREWPGLSYDVTIKVEHLRQQTAMLPVLRETGCAFVTCAVESFDDHVLARLEKGHTRADVAAVAGRFPRGRPDAVAHLRGVHALDDDRQLSATCCARSTGWNWCRPSRRFSTPSVCSSPRARGCSNWTRCARSWSVSIRSR